MGAPNPFAKGLVTVRRMGKDGKPDRSNFNVAGFECTPDKNGLYDIPTDMAERLAAHGYQVVDRDAVESESKKKATE